MEPRPPDEWTFRVDEISVGVYRATARRASGESVTRTGTDPDAVLEQVTADADELVGRGDAATSDA